MRPSKSQIEVDSWMIVQDVGLLGPGQNEEISVESISPVFGGCAVAWLRTVQPRAAGRQVASGSVSIKASRGTIP